LVGACSIPCALRARRAAGLLKRHLKRFAEELRWQVSEEITSVVMQALAGTILRTGPGGPPKVVLPTAANIVSGGRHRRAGRSPKLPGTCSMMRAEAAPCWPDPPSLLEPLAAVCPTTGTSSPCPPTHQQTAQLWRPLAELEVLATALAPLAGPKLAAALKKGVEDLFVGYTQVGWAPAAAAALQTWGGRRVGLWGAALHAPPTAPPPCGKH